MLPLIPLLHLLILFIALLMSPPVMGHKEHFWILVHSKLYIFWIFFSICHFSAVSNGNQMSTGKQTEIPRGLVAQIVTWLATGSAAIVFLNPTVKRGIGTCLISRQDYSSQSNKLSDWECMQFFLHFYYMPSSFGTSEQV